MFDAAGGRVRAAPIRHRASGEQSELQADLVVDATRRSSSTPKWLANWGFGEVAASEVRIVSVAFCEGKALDERLAAGDDHSRAALLRAHLRDRGGSVGARDRGGLPNSAGRRPASGGFRLDLPLH